MIRGFATGSLALIILYAVVQSGVSGRAGEASSTLVAGLRRLLSPGIAGIGNHATAGATGTAPAPGGGANRVGPASTTSTGPLFRAL